jgi:hypothetical protein
MTSIRPGDVLRNEHGTYTVSNVDCHQIVANVQGVAVLDRMVTIVGTPESLVQKRTEWESTLLEEFLLEVPA